jgi:hypothetical protein
MARDPCRTPMRSARQCVSTDPRRRRRRPDGLFDARPRDDRGDAEIHGGLCRRGVFQELLRSVEDNRMRPATSARLTDPNPVVDCIGGAPRRVTRRIRHSSGTGARGGPLKAGHDGDVLTPRSRPVRPVITTTVSSQAEGAARIPTSPCWPARLSASRRPPAVFGDPPDGRRSAPDRCGANDLAASAWGL